MNAKAPRELLDQEPFEPFRIRLDRFQLLSCVVPPSFPPLTRGAERDRGGSDPFPRRGGWNRTKSESDLEVRPGSFCGSRGPTPQGGDWPFVKRS